jgi:DNA-binding NarL/FixJ family response regulator
MRWCRRRSVNRRLDRHLLMARVSIVSTSPAVRAGLRAVLASAGEVRVVGEDATVARALADDPDEATDVLLVEVGSADAVEDVFEVAEGAGVGLLLLGPPSGAERLFAQAPTVPWGYLPPSAGASELAAAIQAVSAGLVALDPSIVGGVGREWRPLSPASDRLSEELTHREREVLHLVSEGLTNKAIAQRLSVSDHTVKFHVASILAKLGAGSRTEAVHLAARHGLIAL